MSNRLKLTLWTLALLLCCACALCEAIPEPYALACQNSKFNLYLRKDTLAVIVESKASGKVLYSTVQNPEKMKDNATWKGFYQSGIVMEYIKDVQSTNTQADFINTKSEITYDFSENGFTAHVLFPDIGISYDAVLTMDERGFAVHIPQNAIIERDPQYTTAAFYIYPFLGHSYMGQDDGYLILPDGQGAIVNLEDNEKRYTSPFNKPVYGAKIGTEDSVYSMWFSDAEPVLLPVFGIVHTSDQIGFLSLIESGDIGARIMGYPNGVRMGFDWVCAQYTYRSVYAQPTGPSSGTVSMRTEFARKFDITQHFLLCDGEDATYAGLGVACRELLAEKGYFDGAARRAFDVGVDFLGLERENDVLGKKDVVMTTFADAERILDDLNSQGVARLSATYRGWQTNGLSGGLPTDGYSPAGSLGGGSGLKALIDTANALSYGMALEADFLTLNTDTHPTLLFSAFKKITGQTFAYPSFGMVYDTVRYLTPIKSQSIAQSTMSQLSQNGVPGVSLTGIPSLMTDYYYANHYQDVSVMKGVYEALVSGAKAEMPTALSSPNAYLWRFADALCDMPIAGSDYTYVDREIPLLAIITSGKIPYYAEYVNFQANTRRFFLRLVEQGARPCFLITQEDPIKLQNSNSSGIYSSRYSLYRDMIASWYRELSELNRAVGDTGILRHDAQGDMVRVTWENGTKVYINFGQARGVMDGITLDALDYKVVNALDR